MHREGYGTNGVEVFGFKQNYETKASIVLDPGYGLSSILHYTSEFDSVFCLHCDPRSFFLIGVYIKGC